MRTNSATHSSHFSPWLFRSLSRHLVCHCGMVEEAHCRVIILITLVTIGTITALLIALVNPFISGFPFAVGNDEGSVCPSVISPLPFEVRSTYSDFSSCPSGLLA